MTNETRQEVSRGAATLIVFPDIDRQGPVDRQARLEEARRLALAIGLDVCAAEAYRVREVRPGTLFGGGQIDEIAALIAAHGAELLVVDGALSAIQQRNLEDRLKCKVIDRTGLILEIFGERAATAEGRLQVELAHLDYQAGRLVRSWTHLERQRGGYGFLGGPGETQIEADRRMIRNRMARLRRELEQVKRTRGLHRARRQRAPWPVVALVGYTNAGKSTLFNRLTHSDVMAEDLLFATLDPTMRSISLEGIDKAILSDTVGFVSDLPTELVAAFRATLEEVRSADIIAHVRDISHSDTRAQARQVEAILADLGVNQETEDEDPHHIPVIEVWNKWDLLDEEARQDIWDARPSDRTICPLSALTGEGVERFLETLSEMLMTGRRLHTVEVAMSDGQSIAWLHAHGQVEFSEAHGDRQRIGVRLTDEDWGRFQAQFASH